MVGRLVVGVLKGRGGEEERGWKDGSIVGDLG